MGFFDDVPEPPPIVIDDPSPRAVWEKPEFMLGGALDLAIVLARTDDAAVCLSQFAAYPNGFEFTLTGTAMRRIRMPGDRMRASPGDGPTLLYCWYRRSHGGCHG